MSAVRISYVLQISGKCAPGILPACNLSVLKIKKQPPHSTGAYDITYALSTFPDLKQEVHTYIFFAPPAVVFTSDGFNVRFPHFVGIFYGNDSHCFRNELLYRRLHI